MYLGSFYLGVCCTWWDMRPKWRTYFLHLGNEGLQSCPQVMYTQLYDLTGETQVLSRQRPDSLESYTENIPCYNLRYKSEMFRIK